MAEEVTAAAGWVEVARLSELRRRRRMLVTPGADPVVLFLIDETVYALADTCIHKGRSLSRGAVLQGRVVCPGHQWSFDPATGQAAGSDRCQPTYPVRVQDGVILLDPRPRVSAPAPVPGPS